MLKDLDRDRRENLILIDSEAAYVANSATISSERPGVYSADRVSPPACRATLRDVGHT